MTIYLLPNTLFEDQDKKQFLSQNIFDAVSQIDGLFAESERAGRRYLSHFKTKISFREMPIVLINEHTKPSDIAGLLKPVKDKKEIWGFVSDCGLPCVADPGEELVQQAYKFGFHIESFSGPCSLLLALQLSGLNAERFSFRGYLPREQVDRRNEIKELESRINKHKETQIVMEAPYRNRELFMDLIEVLSPNVLLVVCGSVTYEGHTVLRKTVADWRKQATFPLEKMPVLFVIGRE